MDMSALTLTDGLVVLVLLLSALLAGMRGLVHEVLAVGGWLGATLAVVYGLPIVQPAFRDALGSDLFGDLTAAGVLFLFTLIGLSFVTRAICKRVRDSAVSSTDRLLGFVFGGVRGAALVMLGFVAVGFLYGEEQPSWVADAQTRPYVEMLTAEVVALIPAEVKESFFARAEAQSEALLEKRAAREEMAKEPEESAITTANPGPDGAPETGYKETERDLLDALVEQAQ